MSVEHMPDERLTHFYENVRQQVEADRANKYHFATGPNVRQYDKLRNEMIKRRVMHTGIEWPLEHAGFVEPGLKSKGR